MNQFGALIKRSFPGEDSDIIFGAVTSKQFGLDVA